MSPDIEDLVLLYATERLSKGYAVKMLLIKNLSTGRVKGNRASAYKHFNG